MRLPPMATPARGLREAEVGQLLPEADRHLHGAGHLEAPDEELLSRRGGGYSSAMLRSPPLLLDNVLQHLPEVLRGAEPRCPPHGIAAPAGHAELHLGAGLVYLIPEQVLGIPTCGPMQHMYMGMCVGMGAHSLK